MYSGSICYWMYLENELFWWILAKLWSCEGHYKPFRDQQCYVLFDHNFIARTNDPWGTVASWVTWHVNISDNSETITDDNKAMELNNKILGTLSADKENYNIFNSKDELDYFIAMKSPWCLICVWYLLMMEKKKFTFYHVLRGKKWDVTI